MKDIIIAFLLGVIVGVILLAVFSFLFVASENEPPESKDDLENTDKEHNKNITKS